MPVQTYDLETEGIQEIMNHPPGWIVRWGATVITLILFAFLMGAWFIRYPDIVSAKVVISYSNPPVKIVSRNNGIISSILATDGSRVETGQPLLVLQSNAAFEDLQQVMDGVGRIDTARDLARSISNINFPRKVQLGDLQAEYSTLMKAVADYQFFIDNRFYVRKIEHLKKQISQYRDLNFSLHEQAALQNQKYNAGIANFTIDSMLFESKTIAAVEYNNSRQRILDQRIEGKNTHTVMIQNTLQQEEYRKNITDIQQQQLQDNNTLQLRIKESIRHLQGQYDTWKENYLIKSPISGKAEFFQVWNEFQYINSGQGIMMITPSSVQYIAKGYVPLVGAGKIKKGQKVLIKLYAFPFEEFGMIESHVDNISSVAMDSVFAVNMKLPSPLITGTSRRIPEQPQMLGVGEVLTEDKSLLQRLFENIYKKWKE